jgi:hypothetical protein
MRRKRLALSRSREFDEGRPRFARLRLAFGAAFLSILIVPVISGLAFNHKVAPFCGFFGSQCFLGMAVSSGEMVSVVLTKLVQVVYPSDDPKLQRAIFHSERVNGLLGQRIGQRIIGRPVDLAIRLDVEANKDLVLIGFVHGDTGVSEARLRQMQATAMAEPQAPMATKSAERKAPAMTKAALEALGGDSSQG